MPTVKLKLDLSGTVGEGAWRNLRHFDLADGSFLDSPRESRQTCNHPAVAAHLQGECVGATIQVETMLLAQYVVSHYLEQDRVLDADVELDCSPTKGSEAVRCP